MIRTLAAALATGTCLVALVSPAAAQTREFNVPAGSLRSALDAFARQSGRQVMYRGDEVRSAKSPGVRGARTAEAALNAIVAGSGFIVKTDRSGAFAVTKGGNARVADSASSTGEVDRIAGDDEIVVTGTNIRGAAPVGSDVITINRRDIDHSGYATVPQLIQSLPQNSGLGANEGNFSRSTVQNANLNGSGGTAANLRGLGPLSTLVLVNGRRMVPSGSGTFADVGVIPLGAVERVEVMPDGASAIYGSDAIGGVINFILRDTLDGAETSLRYGHADGFDQVQLSQLVGKSWSGGSVLLAYDFERRGGLDAAQRSYFTQDLRPFGGHDYRTGFSNPGTILSAGMPYRIPAGQDGRNLEANDLIAGQSNLQDQTEGTTILPQKKQHSLMAVFRQEIAPWFKIFAEGYYAHRTVDQSIGAATSLLTVPSNNPFFVTPVAGAPFVQVQYSFLDDLGATQYRNRVENYTVTLGGEASFSNGWRARFNGSYGVDDQATRLGNIVNNARLAQALAASDPAAAFNPFGDGSHSSPSVIDAIRGYNHGIARYEMKAASVAADGPLFALPGGSARFAIGAEHREEQLGTRAESLQSSLTPLTSRGRTARNVDAVYAELQLPFVGEDNRRPGLRSLALSIAGRYEDYSDFGSKLTPKVGLSWEPAADIGFRASWGKSFQAPALRQLTDTSAAYLVVPLVDPAAPTGRTLTLLYSAPGNPRLKSQTATTWSAGVDLHPRAIPGFKFNITYFNIDYDNLIDSIGFNILNALQLESIYAPLIVRNPDRAFVEAAYASGFLIGAPVDPTLIGAYVNAAPTNLGGLKQSGLDLRVTQSIPVGKGQIGLQASLTWLFKYDVAQTSAASAVDMLGTINNPLDLRGRAGAVWAQGPANAAIFMNYVGGYRNNAVTPVQNVPAWTTFDMQASYSLRPGLVVSFQAQNIFDVAPPFVDSSSFGYDPVAANAIGRQISISIRKSW